MEWFHWIELFIKGLVLGYITSIPLGPIGIIVVQRTLSKGKLSGFVSGLGAASVDTFLAVIAGLGLSFIIDFIEDYSILFKLFGGLIIIFIGGRIFFKSPVRQVRERKQKKSSLHTDYLSVVALTLSNPLAVFLFIAIFAGLNVVNGVKSFVSLGFVFTGIFIGASLWWLTLTSFVNIYRDKFRLKNLWWLNKITGVLIVILGLATLISILFN
ncbi:MAG TPA: LysE family transporter [Bacteroidales bacterium]|nr:LysE family transporter [Bacteroidales bacterium]